MIPFRKKRIIIGVHGLGNKPARRLLTAWWKRAIVEGLRREDCALKTLPFELAYWADFYHPRPQRLRVTDKSSVFYIENPYRPSNPDHRNRPASRLRKKGLDFIERIMDLVLFSGNRLISADAIGKMFMRKFARELDMYYDDNILVDRQTGINARDAIRKQVAGMLRKHKKKEIMLIAHSMGSIIVFDVLTQEAPDVEIHTLVTMGSPLGLPVIIKKILSEQHLSTDRVRQAPTPENIKQAWINVSDLHDKIALNYDLADDYLPNSRSVRPVDHVVSNDYEYEGLQNPHKSYGYLRTPEIAQAVYHFFAAEAAEPRVFFKNIYRWISPKTHIEKIPGEK